MSGLSIETPSYRLEVREDGLMAELFNAHGRSLLRFRPHAALDATDAPDETLAVLPPRRVAGDPPTIEVHRRSTRWDDAVVQLVCADDALEIRTRVRGRGDLGSVRLLALRSLLPGREHGLLPSGSGLGSLFTPNPDDPARVVRPAAESAAIGVVGDSQPGRGRWFFTPAPLYLCLGDGDRTWLGLSVVAPVEELTFAELVYEAGDRAFDLLLDYEGHTHVDGEFSAPTLVLSPTVRDPYEGVSENRALLVARGVAPATAPDPHAWWSEPMFCGWGAQCALAVHEQGRPAADLATQVAYDGFLGTLEREGVVPGTIVIDDKWQKTYGRNEPDRAKWPDLRGWIAGRHARGQRVLLWLKAWDPEGLPAELCVRNPDGAPLGLDPTNPAAREELRRVVTEMLSPVGLDADGFKIDFTARTPTGTAATTHGPGWGIALLHELLRVVYNAAKAAKPDALVVTHTPHPSFVDVTDMVRLNDMLRLDDGSAPASVVPQMRHRAAVARAACPQLLIDTDDWCVPSLAAWREYLVAKPLFGVPVLYYASDLDSSGESFEPGDYKALRDTWAAWRARTT
jgi:hypothetical protein